MATDEAPDRAADYTFRCETCTTVVHSTCPDPTEQPCECGGVLRLEQPPYGLLMPYVVCVSKGGPYDDAAFVAGAQLGQDMAELKAGSPAEWQQYVYPAMVPQYDLVAMHFGYTMTAAPWEDFPDEWVLVTFKKTGETT